MDKVDAPVIFKRYGVDQKFKLLMPSVDIVKKYYTTMKSVNAEKKKISKLTRKNPNLLSKRMPLHETPIDSKDTGPETTKRKESTQSPTTRSPNKLSVDSSSPHKKSNFYKHASGTYEYTKMSYLVCAADRDPLGVSLPSDLQYTKMSPRQLQKKHNESAFDNSLSKSPSPSKKIAQLRSLNHQANKFSKRFIDSNKKSLMNSHEGKRLDESPIKSARKSARRRVDLQQGVMEHAQSILVTPRHLLPKKRYIRGLSAEYPRNHNELNGDVNRFKERLQKMRARSASLRKHDLLIDK